MIAIPNQTLHRCIIDDSLANDYNHFGTQQLVGGAARTQTFRAATAAEGPVQRNTWTAGGRTWFEIRDWAHKDHACSWRSRVAVNSWSDVRWKFMLAQDIGTSFWNDGYDTTNAIGFNFWAGTTTNFEAYSGDGTAPNAVHLDTGITPVDDQFYSFEVRRDASSAETRFYIDDVLVATMNGTQSARPTMGSTFMHVLMTCYNPAAVSAYLDHTGFGAINLAT